MIIAQTAHGPRAITPRMKLWWRRVATPADTNSYLVTVTGFTSPDFFSFEMDTPLDPPISLPVLAASAFVREVSAIDEDGVPTLPDPGFCFLPVEPFSVVVPD
jgi:hypothetical protein